MKKLIPILLILIVVGACAFAATFNIGVTVPQASDVSATLSKIDGKNTPATGDDTWANATALDFSPLVFNAANSTYSCQYYYAMDVGTNGAGPWRIDHTVTGDFANTGSTALGDSVVITCVKQTGTISAPITQSWLNSYGIATLASANGRSFTNTELDGGWLRLYYGIYNGAANGTADYVAGAVPITSSKSSGLHTGTVSVTLTKL